jgi:Flp pilus assembly protein TadB
VIWFGAVLTAALLAGVAVVVLYKRGQQAKRRAIQAVRDAEAARRQAEIEKAEAARLARLATKTEEIHATQNEQRDQVSSGDPAADFAGSIDVLSDLSAKRRTGRGH